MSRVSHSQSGPLSGTRFGKALLWLTAASALLTVISGVAFWQARSAALQVARDRAHGEAVRAAQVISDDMDRLPNVVRGIADDLSSGRTGRNQLLDRLKVAIETTPQLSGVGAAYAVHQYDPNLRLYAPYYRRQGEQTELIELDSLYDYTQGNRDWYQLPFSQGASWSEPSLTDASPVPVVEFSAPFTDGPSGTDIVGVIHGTMALSDADDLIRSLDLGDYGYGFLVSREGFVISHPFGDELTSSPASEAGHELTDDADKRAAARAMFDTIRTGQAGLIDDAVDPVTGEASWVFSEPVASTGWTVGVVFFKGESTGLRLFRRHLMRLTLSALLLCLCILALGTLVFFSGSIKQLWVAVLMASGLLVLGIGALWTEGYASAAARSPSTTVFANSASVRAFVLSSTRASLRSRGALPFFVPTGVFLQTLDLAGPNSVTVTGYVWQRYASNVPTDVARGFTLPEASDSTIEESYRYVQDEEETIGWTFRATIRQRFDYSKYPLDQQEVQLRIWPADIDKGVVLIPDLNAYRLIHPLARLGLEKRFSLPGWNVERTQFSNETTARHTTFGLATGSGETVEELSFSVVLNRRVLEPVFSSLLPLAVVGFMVSMLLFVVKESTRGNVVQILSAFSGLFFVGVLSQLDLRRRLSSSSVTYIEFFYFVTYAAILVVALIVLTNAYPGYVKRVEQREHLIPKLMFWPTILTVMLLLTVMVFY